MPAPKGHPNWNVNGGGRPRIYDDEFIENEALAFYEWIERNEGIYFKEFAFNRGYSPKQLAIFAERNQNFKVALETAHEWQEIKLATGGLTKIFDPGFTKFVMARTCGWRDEKTVNVNSNTPIPDWVVEAEGKSKHLVKNDESAS
jgi:hypothetical protein